MDFKTDTPIYKQIIDYCFSRILSGTWPPGEKVQSVRELAVQMAVNTHTVLKAYDYLQQNNLIISRRGMGYFLANDAKERVDELRRQDFFSARLDSLFSEMEMLGIDIADIDSHWQQWKSKRKCR